MVTRETHRILHRDLDPSAKLSVPALCGYLQEAASSDARALGASMEVLNASQLAWVLYRLRIEIFGPMPSHGQTIEIVTWQSGADRFRANRDFRAFVGDRLVARAGSFWVVFDLKNRRAGRLPEFLTRVPSDPPDEPLPLARLPKPDGPIVRRLRVDVRDSDLDEVGHVSHLHLLAWILDSGPESLRWTTPSLVDVTFSSEVTANQTVEIARRDSLDRAFVHTITTGSGTESVRATTRWDPSGIDGLVQKTTPMK